jgi:hypothetical protein
MRVGRRRTHLRGRRWIITGVVLVLVAGLAAGGYHMLKPSGLATLPEQAVVAPGGFRASIGAPNTITVGLEIRNASDVTLTVISARIVAPAGLTSVKLAVVASGKNNEGFALEGDLPASTPVQLGTEATSRNGIIAARFTVDCAGLLAAGGDTGERIFVTIQVDQEQRIEEITPPVVGDTPWLTATAKRVCLDPIPTGAAEPPLPPLAEPSNAPAAG